MGGALALYNELQRQGVNFYLWDMGEEKAATICIGNQCGVFMDFDNIHTSAEEAVLVAHEGGHICTGALHHVNSPYEIIEQHENRADKWAISRLVPKEKLEAAIAHGTTEIWDLAEWFGVTEDFMRKAVCWYKNGNLAINFFE